MTRTFNDNWAVRMVHTPDDAYDTVATYGTWINMQGFRRCAFIPMAAGLSGNIVCKIYEATDSSGTNAQEVDTALASTFTNGTDENLPGIIEVRDSDLTADYNYVTLQVTPAAGDPFACVAVLGEPYSAPVANTVNTHVAFNTGE